MKSRLVAAMVSLGAIQCQTNSPPPDLSEQHKVLADATQFAINHEANLPNFVCTQTTRSFEDVDHTGWRPTNLIVERLTHFEDREVYRVMMLNEQSATISNNQLRPASSSGEFGSVMRAIFLPQTEAEFRWLNWVNLRGKRMSVYTYRIPAFKSSYHIEVAEQSVDLVAGYRGLIFIENEKHVVHRITLYADEIPPSFPIQDISLSIDYDYARIGEADYLMPLHFELRSRHGVELIRSDVDYSDYRKFSVIW